MECSRCSKQRKFLATLILATGSCHEDSRSAAFIGLTSILAGHTFLLEFISELFTVSVPVLIISSVLGISFCLLMHPTALRNAWIQLCSPGGRGKYYL